MNMLAVQVMGLALRNRAKGSVPSRELKDLCALVLANDKKISSRIKILGKPSSGNAYNHGWERPEPPQKRHLRRTGIDG